MERRSASAEPAPPTGERPSPLRREIRSFAELFALAGLAFTQPLLDVFGRAPDHFVFRGAGRGDIIAFALVVTILPAAIAHLVEAAVGLASARARRIVHLGFLGAFTTIFLTLAFDGVLIRTAAIGAAATTAALLVLLHERTRGVRIWLAFLSPAPIVFLVLFLTASPVASLLGPSAPALDVEFDGEIPDPVVILLLDEFPLVTLLDEAGDIDADLFPNFARLADTSHWFRQATTTSNTTVRAVPTMLTGRIPEGEGSPTSNSHPENLFTLVGGSMPVTSSEVLTRMCPATICDPATSTSGGEGGLGGLLTDARDVLHRRLAPNEPDHDPLTTQAEADPAGPAPAEGAGEHREGGEDGGLGRFDRFVDQLADGPDGLHFFHLLQPHRPHRHLPDGRVYNAPSPAIGRFLENWVSTPEPVAAAHQQYLLQLQWTDRLVGRLIDTLQDAGAWDETTVIVLADHGFGFQPGGPVRAMADDNDGDDTAIAQILWIPFFVKTADQHSGEVSDDPVRIVDLLPTVADLLDVDVPWETDGRSVFDGGSGDPDEVGFHRSIAGRGHAGSPYRSLDRAAGHDLLLRSTTGAFAPAHEGITGSDRIHAVGPRPDLFGRPVPPGAPEIDVDIDPGSRIDDLDPAEDPLPIVFRARTSSAEPGEPVAIAVDGTVWATATVFGGTEAEIVALLPPRAVDDHPDRLTVHRITDEP